MTGCVEVELIIAIDGPSGSGKSTVSRALASALGFQLLDTGALYRAVALLAHRGGIDLADGGAVSRVMDSVKMSFKMVENIPHLFIDDEDVSGLIRNPMISEIASKVSQHSKVRKALLRIQREIGSVHDCVIEGRDIGTVVFPDADFKFFLTASEEERVARRKNQYEQKGERIPLDVVRKEVLERDERD
jgi:cytidylate kinase